MPVSHLLRLRFHFRHLAYKLQLFGLVWVMWGPTNRSQVLEIAPGWVLGLGYLISMPLVAHKYAFLDNNNNFNIIIIYLNIILKI